MEINKFLFLPFQDVSQGFLQHAKYHANVWFLGTYFLQKKTKSVKNKSGFQLSCITIAHNTLFNQLHLLVQLNQYISTI